MLTALKIKNLALVDDLTWEVGSGLVTVTGETGAGKSIIVGALKLILGERAGRDLLRFGEKHCTVEAVFEISNRDEVNAILENAGLELCEENQLVLKRVFSIAGSNKQFVNCGPATLAALKQVGNVLVDLHGPHDHQSLLSQERQLQMLDAYAGPAVRKCLAAYRTAYDRWTEANRDYLALRDAEQTTGHELELLRFQVEEIQNAGLRTNEEAELEQQYAVASNSQRLIETASTISNKLSEGPMAILSQLASLQKSVRELERIDDATSELLSGFDTVQVELDELCHGLQDYVSNLEVNPEEVRRLENRLDLIQGLKRKYGQTVEDIMEFGQRAERKLNATKSRSDELHRLEELIDETRQTVDKAGKALSRKRHEFAPKLAKEVSGHLKDLGFKQSKFEIAEEPHEQPSATGLEQIDFQFAPNPGEPFKPLRVIASSGEMSRVMLAVKNALADQDQIPLMVFDEIDANVGGQIARAVGQKMATLGEKHQVVAITHMPQVASLSQYHYLVQKEVRSGKTRSTLKRVDGEARVAEIERMLGGGGETAKALAEEMLKNAAP
tara:strand:- start:8342 stop:10012 length:1671 start_codon:yes stop_codon:yes gene_type:complete